MPWGVAAAAIGAYGAISSADKNADTQKAASKKNNPVTQANAQAALNNTNQTTPYGSSTWYITGQNPDGTNIYANNQTLSAPLQQQFDQKNQTAANLGSASNNLSSQINGMNPIDASGIGSINYGMTPEQQANYSNNMAYSAGNAATYNPNTASYGSIINDAGVPQNMLDADLQTQRDAYYKQQQGFLDPQWEQQQQQLATQLANSGVAQNSEAYNKAMENFNRQREFSYNNARQAAIQAGGAEQSRLNNMALQNAQFHNDAQNQGFGQSLGNAQIRNQADQFNAGSVNQMNQFNANLNNDALNNQATTTLANAQQNNAGVSQALQQLFQLRNAPINELNSIQGGMQIQSPSFTNTNGTPIDMMGAMQNQYQQQLASANNKAQGDAALYGTIGNVVGNTNWGSLFNFGNSSTPQQNPAYSGWNINNNTYGVT